MQRKIVAIGGGSVGGSTRADGTISPWETEPIDREIVRLTGKAHPNLLVIAHAQRTAPRQEGWMRSVGAAYAARLGCIGRFLSRETLESDFAEAEAAAAWADIIYESGGDTLSMTDLWRATGFDRVLRQAWEAGTVLCGVSAGANCWFDSCSSDSLQILRNDPTAPLISVEGIHLVRGFFTPHCDEKSEYFDRLDHMKNAVGEQDTVGFGLSNGAALEIVDDTWRVLTGDASAHGIEPYGAKGYWKNGEYVFSHLPADGRFRPITELLARE